MLSLNASALGAVPRSLRERVEGEPRILLKLTGEPLFEWSDDRTRWREIFCTPILGESGLHGVNTIVARVKLFGELCRSLGEADGD